MRQIGEQVLFSDSAQVWDGEFMDVCYIMCRRFTGSALDGVIVERWRIHPELGLVDYHIMKIDALDDETPDDAAAIRKTISLFNEYLVANGGEEIK